MEGTFTTCTDQEGYTYGVSPDEAVPFKYDIMKKEILMLEKQIERKLVNAVKAAGGICPKFVSPGLDGMPDRLVLLPGGRIAFVEVKAPGKEPRPLQLHCHDRIRELGFPVYVISEPDDVPFLMTVMNYLDVPI